MKISSEKLMEKITRVVNAFVTMRDYLPLADDKESVYVDIDERYQLYKEFPYSDYVFLCDRLERMQISASFDYLLSHGKTLGELIGMYLELSKEES